MEYVDATVIGAGPGGLGAAGLLTQAGLRTVLLERGDGVGAKWRGAYDRLHINTSTLTSYLPGAPFPRSIGRWPSRDELVAYYQDFATAHEIDVRLGVSAESVERRGPVWQVRTSDGDISAASVVVATGREGTPFMPAWEGTALFGGTLMHASEYRSAQGLQGKRVLVVGVGNSGSDIAVDLLEGGADVSVSIRTPPHMVRRTVAGVPNDVLQLMTRRIPAALVDVGAEWVRRRAYGDLEDLGLGRPPTGIKTYIKTTGRVPTIDSGPFSQAVRQRRIQIHGPLMRLESDGAVIGEEQHLAFDVVLAATGYRPNLQGLLGHLGVLSESGRPRWAPRLTDDSTPGLFIVGFGDPTRGNLRGLRMDAVEVCKAILASRRDTAIA